MYYIVSLDKGNFIKFRMLPTIFIIMYVFICWLQILVNKIDDCFWRKTSVVIIITEGLVLLYVDLYLPGERYHLWKRESCMSNLKDKSCI